MTASTIKLDSAEECARWLVRYGVTPRQIRDWARRGNITRHGDLYELREIADYLDNRPDADKRRAAARTLHSVTMSATMRARDASPETG